MAKIKIGQRYKALQTIGDGNPVITKDKIYNIIDIDDKDGYNSGYYINDFGKKDSWVEKTWNNKDYFELVGEDGDLGVVSMDINNKFIYEIGKTRVKTICPTYYYNFEGTIVGDTYDATKDETVYHILDKCTGQTFMVKREDFKVIEEKKVECQTQSDVFIPDWIKELKLGDNIKWRNGADDSTVLINNRLTQTIYYENLDKSINDNFNNRMTYKDINYYAITPVNTTKDGRGDIGKYTPDLIAPIGNKSYLKWSYSKEGKWRSECSICGDITGICKHQNNTYIDNEITQTLLKKWNSGNSNFNKFLSDWEQQYNTHWTIQREEDNILPNTSASDILYGKK